MTSRSLLHPGLRAASAAVALALSADPAPAHADPAVASVRIENDALSPALARATQGRFSLENRAAATARVEFDLPRGEGIACASATDGLHTGRKFVIAPGDTLECSADAGRLAYEVYRQAPGGAAASAASRTTGILQVDAAPADRRLVEGTATVETN